MTTRNWYSWNLFRYIVRRKGTHSSKPNLKELLLKMPWPQNHVQEMRNHRLKLKEKGKKYLPGILYLQVLGSGSRGSPRSLYFFTDRVRYMFNCSEGTQRLALEHKCKLAKLEHIFITRPTWENLGGLPGLALSAQDVGVPQFVLHGPQGTDELFAAAERFIILKSLGVSLYDCNCDNMYEDDVMTVRYVRLTKKDSGLEESDSDHSLEYTDDDTDYYAHEVNRNGKRLRLVNKTEQRSKIRESLNSNPRITDAMAYICKLKPRPGALSLIKCVEEGVPSGPLLGKLKEGEDVTLEDGRIVKSADVLAPGDSGSVIIVLECPTVDYLESLVENPVFENYQQSTAEEDNIPFCIAHFTPVEVMADPHYKKWMNDFGPGPIHLVLNEQNDCLGSEAVHRMQHKLHLLHPTIFPFLSEQGFDKENPPDQKIVEDNEEKLVEQLMGNSSRSPIPAANIGPTDNTVIQAKTLHCIHLRPKNGLDRSLELKLQPKEYADEAMNNDGFLDALACLQTDINLKTKELGEIAEYPKLIFLGTGSCAPNKHRNTSGILFRITENSSIMFDCGEGTLTQLMRFYGKSEAYRVLASIKAIYISHLHADHHMGLIGLLKARMWATEKPAFVLAPKQISAWLSFYHRRFEPILDKFTLIANGDLTLNSHNELSTEKCNNLFAQLGAKDVSTRNVKHVANSFGVSVTLNDGFKVTYSGDTMPCRSLVDLGRNSDLLIHEATMEDELESEARLKFHSTISQAINIGQQMHAKFTLLTHFSQRYAKIPILPDDAGKTVGIAFDNMQVRVGELPILPLLYPALRVMFSEAWEELDNKATRRKLRLQYGSE
ncbi:ribonuclease Z, mitochondrial [Neodiprion pinetum]|uniref:ribonuclease Z, mitochondrial n=1 Tax=Neodiprion pinetum TaxID=441929 RepID=UPI001EE0E7FA|nr:ribonuclease Z, mitochondrial [Neodiprion pinetum]XP_046478205.1 ribonuclease Z, mitochondrial [Neodiprion pinetum]XP_046478206.1 ribonuclease Z, mitochondrial [Neodiprion pinetum]XP_046478207.1 ribonuclease Z, mitochondrial [Neodiprion pinetum]XP_046478210.1 ribonuclease Z, mitochondrial [Neodiprion pinetum]